MPCSWTVHLVETELVEFVCGTCSRHIAFVFPAYGSPNPVWNETTGLWEPPADALNWLDPCPPESA